MDYETLLTQLLERWRADEIAADAPSTIEEVRAFERRHGVRMPPDIERYFLTVGGMQGHSMDEHHLCFWPLAEVEPLSEDWLEAGRTIGERYFAFADGMIRSHAYAVRLEDGRPNTVVSTAGPELEVVADSFEEFLRLYLQDPEAIGA